MTGSAHDVPLVVAKALSGPPPAPAPVATPLPVPLPEAARDYGRRAAESAREKAGALAHAVEDATNALESAAAGTVAATAGIARELQAAVFADAQSAIAGFEAVVRARSFDEALDAQAAFVRTQLHAQAARVRSAGALFWRVLNPSRPVGEKVVATVGEPVGDPPRADAA